MVIHGYRGGKTSQRNVNFDGRYVSGSIMAVLPFRGYTDEV